MQFCDKLAYVWGLYYRWSPFANSATLCHPGHGIFCLRCLHLFHGLQSRWRNWKCNKDKKLFSRMEDDKVLRRVVARCHLGDWYFKKHILIYRCHMSIVNCQDVTCHLPLGTMSFGRLVLCPIVSLHWNSFCSGSFWLLSKEILTIGNSPVGSKR